MKKFLSIILAVLMIATVVPMAYAEDDTYEVGDIIQFGSYPQTEVKDEALIAELNALAPSWDNWNNYGYYSGTGYDGSMVQGDWMRYTDITYKGNKYRGVKFTQYRPFYTIYSSSPENTHQDDNGYNTNIVYWFKFDSIDWRVLNPNTGLIMCETIIDSQPYSNTLYYNANETGLTYAYFNDASYKIYASDYVTSSIRKWLNEDFFNTAFTDDEKKEIATTTLNNNGYYTLVGITSYKKLDCNETEDKIFLLSYKDTTNSNFGFNPSYSVNDVARQAKGSNYAQSQGLYVFRGSNDESDGCSYWFLRSPGLGSLYCCHIASSGIFINHYNVDNTRFGVRPALCLKDIYNYSHTHTYTSKITTPATHTKDGVETFTCACGDSYTKPVAKLPDHTYTSKVTKEPTHLETGVTTYTCECGDSYTEDIAKTSDHNYSTVVTAPTCKTKGYTTYTCKCGHSYVGDYVAVLKHNYTSVVTKNPTHLTVGKKTYTCSLCGDVYTEDIARTPEHTYSVSKVTEPTCTDKGYTTYTCACGESYKDNYVSAKGHNYNGEICKSCGAKCSHMCHKSGFMGFIWKIVRFFCKLFKCKPVCTCGVAHY